MIWVEIHLGLTNFKEIGCKFLGEFLVPDERPASLGFKKLSGFDASASSWLKCP